jgi:hypothetical protein
MLNRSACATADIQQLRSGGERADFQSPISQG